jgi:hypothetical protein
MILSVNEELNEYALVREPEHIAAVWKVVEASLPKYWDMFVTAEREKTPAAKLAAKFGGDGTAKEGTVVAKVFDQAVEDYEDEAAKYRKFFDPDSMDEYFDDPNAFKQGLSRDVPVIANTLRQRQAELKEWQMHFRSSRPKDLLEVFTNVLDFREEWSTKHPPNGYTAHDTPVDFDLDPLDNDESMSLVNVVGMGIKSIILYHLDAERMPPRGRNALYGLFFLSGKGYFGLPSKSSEFLMINDRNPASDGSIIMDQNYWYPYGAFCVYAIRVFRWIEQRAKANGFTVDPKLRYVYVDRFFRSVCDHHEGDLKTMRAHERFEVPA